MVATLITATCYNRIAGIITLIAFIAILNNVQIKEGMANPLMSLSGATPAPSAPSISFNTPDEFRQKYCVKGIPDEPTQSGKLIMTYMLSPSFFTKMDASGNPIVDKEQIDAMQKIDHASYNTCTPLTVANGGTQYETINNMCDPKCNWKMKTPSPTSAPSDNGTEGFTQMLRSHIRNGRDVLTNGINDLKSSATRMKRQLF